MYASRHASRFGLFLAALAVLPRPALAQIDAAAYLAGSLGASLQNSRSVTASTLGTPGASDSSAHFGTGVSAGITPGYTFGDNFRSDLELSYRSKPGKHDGIDEKAYAALANAWVDVIHQHGYFIYFGGGVGLAGVELHSSNGSDSAIPAVWQLGAGSGLTLTPNWAIAADFRRVTAFDRSSFHVDNAEDLKTRYGTNAVTITLRYAFGAMPESLFGRSAE